MNLRHRIVSYWSTAGLSCPISSTSSADPLIAAFDNDIENRVLGRLLSELDKDLVVGSPRIYALDVGAGYGRFTQTFLEHFDKVFLLEGAAGIHAELLSHWSGREDVACLRGVFEELQKMPVVDFSLIFASGVLYLYDDDCVDQFFVKAESLLTLGTGCRIVLRDFVSPTSRVLNSSFVEGGFCYYRDIDYWRRACEKHDLELVKVIRSKPAMRFIRSTIFNSFARRLKVQCVIFNSKRVRDFFCKHGGWSFDSNDIHTVFIEIKRHVRYRR
jgi:SAM-dependent methyltransferase